jgi:hypothetical protein
MRSLWSFSMDSLQIFLQLQKKSLIMQVVPESDEAGSILWETLRWKNPIASEDMVVSKTKTIYAKERTK